MHHFAADLFHLERNAVEETIPIEIQNRAVNSEKWCALFQEYFLLKNEDTFLDPHNATYLS